MRMKKLATKMELNLGVSYTQERKGNARRRVHVFTRAFS
jgi:hypothetical protein